MKGDVVYPRHIVDAIEKIETYVAVGHDVFLAQSHWHDAAIRQLEIIGEAAKRLSQDLRDQYAHVPWRRITGLRDVLIHDCMGVDLEAVWEVTQENLLDLKRSVEAILKQLGDDT
jgi:uncharacterized protein with HEPN domain